MASSLATPSEWPDSISENYTAVRILGKGGFASVVLAKVKPGAKVPDRVKEYTDKAGGLVAIKVAGNAKDGVSASEKAYGHREIDILQAISHVNIMKCLDFVEPSPGKGMALVLSYSKGPTVESLLKHGGALSTEFGRVVIAQVVDAISFLHNHAVVHRDIKPDNIIVTGAVSSQREIWDNPEDYDDDDPQAPTGLSDWAALMKKWHVTLVDFGFARALTPKDVIQPSPEIKKENLDASFHSLNHSLGRSGRMLGGSSHGKRTSLASGGRRGSISTMLHRQMSALGSPQFAAPEIKRVHKADTTTTSSTPTTSITNTISNFVADYGLLVDAYSLGMTIRYMMTGCAPHVSVSQAKAGQLSLVEQLCGLCMQPKKRGLQPDGTTRLARFRYVEDLPGEVHRLISKMTEPEESKRTSVRSARRYHWINDVLQYAEEYAATDADNTATNGDNKNKMEEIQYLDFALVEQPMGAS